MPGMCACVEQELGNSPWFAGVHLMCLRHAPLQPHSRPRKIKKKDTHTGSERLQCAAALCIVHAFSLHVSICRSRTKT